ncbi:nucleotidyltransferase family protein [Christiangramia fulva]|uniref:Nucleotidyltransferase family protein n=1 Tax=Christiangramia fulva TaxID=2126553 RepID=A0A2R3Z9B5_9FLAO|nr:nucleotidyltransferase family protein [Christiangramia fulva]AVR46830.1 nucleotidyltransferase family protein [Christiangramia fulva]
MIENKKIGVVILAAGASSRLGYPKQLVEFEGKKLLQKMIDLADDFSFDSKVLVLGANANEIKKEIDSKNFSIAINGEWNQGMSSSIIKGITSSEELEKLDHLLILLSDQPFVNREKIEQLIRLQIENKSEATFSEYEGDIGVPAIFSRSVFQKLKELKGDHGAKKLIYNDKIEFQTIKFEKGNFDVDTKEDVELLKQLEKK